VNDATAEAAQLAAWGIEPEAAQIAAEAVRQVNDNRLMASEPGYLTQPAHDGGRKPGGSLKQPDDDLPALRIAYKEKFGKKAFGGWDAAEITKRMEAAA
jgi:hypothetical protein